MSKKMSVKLSNKMKKIEKGFEIVKDCLEGINWNNSDPFNDFGIFERLDEEGFTFKEIELLEKNFHNHL